jgi:hypothetical protein
LYLWREGVRDDEVRYCKQDWIIISAIGSKQKRGCLKYRRD